MLQNLLTMKCYSWANEKKGFQVKT